MTTRRTIIVAAAMGLAITACASRSDSIPIAAGGPGDSGASTTAPTTSASTSTSREGGAGAVGIAIDVTTTGEEISPLILGVSYDLSGPEMQDIGVRLSSWGGNLATRFNYVAGNLWNAALDWEYRNTDYGQDGDVLRSFLVKNEEVGAENRVAVPTIGWIAKDSTSCSFPDGAGGCTIADRANCKNPGPIGDPGDTSVPSTPEMVAGLVRDLLAEGRDIRFVAMDNEPELWGDTHYDVHPACPTFEEIAATYLDYAMAVRAVAPDAELMGPVMCCWYDYWRSDPGPADGSDTDFLTWFLKRVREHDDAAGVRTLDVVDVHFYPQSGVFNEDTDPETNARRLRSVRGLWDHEYTDESWIDEPIAFIPRLQQIVDAAYPGTPLAISEWNFGAETSMNGALAIADALGVYGREGVYAAAYWRAPPVGSPGYLAFKMHGNYDDRGARFGGAVVEATSEDDGTIGAYAALDEGVLKVMLLNKDPDDSHAVTLGLTGFEARSGADRWTYGSADPDRIVADTVDAVAPIHLSPSSITVLELRPAP